MITTIETTYKIPGAPSLALLTDFHNTDPVPILSSLRSRRPSLRSHAPSLICIAGDVIVGKWPEGDQSPLVLQTNVLPFLSACADIAPTFFSLGNHEWMLDGENIKEIENTGVTVLDNEWREVAVGEKKIIVGGLTSGYVTDYRSFRSTHHSTDRYPRKEDISGMKGIVVDHKPDTAWLEEYCSIPGYHILLSHHPEYWPKIKEKKIELVLSGHAHGGQWRFFNRGVFAPGQGWWPRWTRGVYEEKLVVSAGLSNTTWVPRIWNPTEVVYVEGS